MPTKVLRAQIAAKFETWGVLKRAEVIPHAVPFPSVGCLVHHLTSVANAQEFAGACNVVVATVSVLNKFAPDVRTAFLAEFTHLFVDEAHHVEASTWSHIRQYFEDRPVVQFTATPFREDGKQLGGKLLYTYPLRAAQEHEYFAGIDYISVPELGDRDRVVATTALTRLREDLASDRDHLLMARVKSINRAAEVLEVYRELGPEFRPVVLMS